MAPTHTSVELVRLSSELVAESAKLRTRARETISQSDAIIDRSRALLSLWPVGGMPASQETQNGCTQAEALCLPVSPAKTVAHEADLEGDGLERIAGRDFTGEVLLLDGRHFVDCSIENCVLEYSGGPVVLESTNFSACRFRFGGEAAMTVSMLECFGLMEEKHARALVSPAERVN